MPIDGHRLPQRDRDRTARERGFDREKAKLDRMSKHHEDVVFERADIEPTNAVLQCLRQAIRRQMNVCWYYDPHARLRAPYHEEDIQS